LPDGSQFQPVAISDGRLVVGSFVTAAGEDGAWVWEEGEGMQNVRTATTLGATDEFATSTDFELLGITDTGRVVGSLNDFRTAFTLSPFNVAGPFTGAGAVSLSGDNDGNLQASTRNEASEIVAFRRGDDDTDTWT